MVDWAKDAQAQLLAAMALHVRMAEAHQSRSRMFALGDQVTASGVAYRRAIDALVSQGCFGRGESFFHSCTCVPQSVKASISRREGS